MGGQCTTLCTAVFGYDAVRSAPMLRPCCGRPSVGSPSPRSGSSSSATGSSRSAGRCFRSTPHLAPNDIPRGVVSHAAWSYFRAPFAPSELCVLRASRSISSSFYSADAILTMSPEVCRVVIGMGHPLWCSRFLQTLLTSATATQSVELADFLQARARTASL